MSTRNDVDARTTLVTSIQPQAVASNTTVNGTSIDMRSLGHAAKLLVIASVGTRTDGSYLFVVQDSADNSSFAAATLFSGSLSATAAASTNKTGAFVPTAGRPFVRVSVTSSAVTTGAVIAADLIALGG